MSKMSEMCLEIETMLVQGTHPSTISAVLGVPVTWVYDVSDTMTAEVFEVFDPFMTVISYG